MNHKLTPLRLYNTQTRRKEVFSPLDSNNVRMYVCGPTVYDFAHIGNARPVIVFDVLFRLLRYLYGSSHVIYARNITDVDDKINERAFRDYPDLPPNEAIRHVTDKTDAQFQEDVRALGNIEPTRQPRVTENIPAICAFIERLIDVGVAYLAADHVLFSPSRMNKRARTPHYGALARRSLEDAFSGASAEKLSFKHEIADFVLWKPSGVHEPSWPSPAGISVPGRPGWHIECSAIAMTQLLEPFGGGLQSDNPLKNIFDIHGGGVDLVFPHHENEIAQSCCAFSSDRMANIWMHNGFVQLEGRKMSKSEGNFITIRDLLKTQCFGNTFWSGEVLRLAILKTHYRDPLDFSLAKLHEASANLMFWRQAIGNANAPSDAEPDEELINCLKDDLNTSAAFHRINQLAKESRASSSCCERFLASANMIGLFSSFVDSKRQNLSASIPDENYIREKIELRKIFIEEKNWSQADLIRDELLSQGVRLKDQYDSKTDQRIVLWEIIL